MDDELETPPPSKLKAAIPLVGVLLLGLGGGFGASMMMGGGEKSTHGEAGEEASAEAGHGEAPTEGHGKPAEAAAEEHGAPAAEGHGEPAAEHGATAAAPAASATGATGITSLGRFTVNLRGSGGGRILQMEVALEADPSATGSLESLTPRLRDSINTAVSDYTWTELEGTDGKTRLKDELLTRINGVADPVVVHAVYLTSFVVS